VAVDSPMAFGEVFVEAMERDDLGVIVARVDAVGPDNYGMDFALPENAFRFKRCAQERRSATGWTPPPQPGHASGA